MPASAHLAHSPFVTIELDSEEVVVEGKTYKVTKLGSASSQDFYREEAKKRSVKRPKSLAAYLKTVSPKVKAEYKLGVKIAKMPLASAERVVKASLLAVKLEALREKTGLKYIHSRAKIKYAAELAISAETISSEMARLMVVVSAVESAVCE